MNPILLTSGLVVSSVFLFGCKTEVSFESLESARTIVNAIAHFNAAKFRAENGYEKLNMLVRGDSTQQNVCPQGDGWASVDLIDANSKQPVVKLKCSTVSPNIGCMTADDFKSRLQYSAQENQCNTSLPYPPKKIEQ